MKYIFELDDQCCNFVMGAVATSDEFVDGEDALDAFGDKLTEFNWEEDESEENAKEILNDLCYELFGDYPIFINEEKVKAIQTTGKFIRRNAPPYEAV